MMSSGAPPAAARIRRRLANISAHCVSMSGGIAPVFGSLPETPLVTRNGPSNELRITLNLKYPRGREVFVDSLKHAYVVAEDFSSGVLERLSGTQSAAASQSRPV